MFESCCAPESLKPSCELRINDAVIVAFLNYATI